MIGIDSANLGRLSMNLHRSSNGVRNSVDRLVNAGNATESLRAQGDQGGLSMVSRLGSENRTKSALSKSMQNAVSYIQMQEAGLKKAHQLYERMSLLASQAMDPLLSQSDRSVLSTEFETLRQDSLSIRADTYEGKILYDDIAAYVKKMLILVLVWRRQRQKHMKILVVIPMLGRLRKMLSSLLEL